MGRIFDFEREARIAGNRNGKRKHEKARNRGSGRENGKRETKIGTTGKIRYETSIKRA